MLQAPNNTALASSSSTDILGKGNSSGWTWAKMFRTDGAFVLGSVIWKTSPRSEEHTSELQSRLHLVCRLLLEKKKKKTADVRQYQQTEENIPQAPHTSL